MKKNNMETEIKYYGLTFHKFDENYKNRDIANDFIAVVKVWEDKELIVNEDGINLRKISLLGYIDEEGQEITREQFDEFYKKTVEKINEAAHV